MLLIKPSCIAAPSSIDVTDFVTEKEIHLEFLSLPKL